MTIDDEVKRRWGQTDAYAQSRRRTATYTQSDWQRHKSQADAIESALVGAMVAGLEPDSERSRAIAEQHRMMIDTWFYACPHEMHTKLADMYVADPRFAKHYDKRASGLARYLRDAIYANAVDRG